MPIHKKLIMIQQGWRIYTIDAFAIRSLAQPDEEFTNFATQEDFPKLIPKGEVWIAQQNFEVEGVFFLANAMAQLQQRAQGIAKEKAYDSALQIERQLRSKVNGVKFRRTYFWHTIPKALYVERYLTLNDVQNPVEIWRVDGNLVRSLFKTDYTEGGHGQVYAWIPKNQIWLEKDLDRRELPFIASHEYLELRMMRDLGLDYDRAHAIAARLEFALRKGRGLTKILAPKKPRITKRELPQLTRPDIFEYVASQLRRGQEARELAG